MGDAIDAIKERLLSARELSDVADCFLAWFESGAEAQGAGDRFDPPDVVRRVVAAVVCGALGRRVELERDVWIRLAPQRFVHCGFQVGPCWGNVFYFEDLGMGLVTVADLNAGQTHHARFALAPNPPADPSLN